MGRRVGYAWVRTVGQKLDVPKLDVQMDHLVVSNSIFREKASARSAKE